MNRKAVVFVISIFLGILFLSTVGNHITGFILLAKPSAATLSNFPRPFLTSTGYYNNLFIVKPDNPGIKEDNAAIIISKYFQGNKKLPPKIVTVSGLPQGVHNLILIGNPCNNELIAKELNTKKCSLGKNGDGVLKLVNHDFSNTLVLSGEVEKSAKILIGNKNYYPLRGKSITISGVKSSVLHYNN